MKLSFGPGERATLVAQLGLNESASTEEIGAAVVTRLMETPSPSPSAQASAATQPAASGPEEYPSEWLSPSQLAPWPRPMAPRQRVTHGGD